ncbi:unnamed protein product, partial [Rhizoctonia solani]
SKRELEEPGDISVARAPAAPKKPKAASVGIAKKTRSATKQAQSDDNDDQTPVQTISKPDEDPVRSQSTLTTTKAARNKKPATSIQKDPQTPDDLTPIEPPLSTTDGKKSSRPKQLSAVAEKVNKQAVAKQNAKETQAAKKAKKAEEAVIEETPEETAAFLAKVKGQSKPSKTSPNLVSPKRSRPPVNREKALEQLLNARAPSPNPGAAPLANDDTTNNTARINNVALSNSAPQASNSRPRPRIVTQPGLQVPRSTPPSRDVSPVAPPLLQIPSSTLGSREVSPSAESMATADNDYDEDIDIAFDYKALLDGIPKPWNLGPVSAPPPLPKPLHTAMLNPEVMEKAANGGKEKSRVARPLVNSFRVQDQVHLKLALEYMDALVATICAFPDDDTRWTFATLSNYWASKKLGRNYRLDRQSDYCRLLYSRISQSRGRLVSAVFSDGIRDNYDGLSWRPTTGSNKAQTEAAIRSRVVSMIQDGSFTAPADRPSAYYQNPWFGHILKLGYWQLSTSKGMSEAHAEHFGGGISYPLMALVVTATEKMLAAVAAGPNSTNTGHKNTGHAFSHTRYASRFHSHLLTLTKIHRTRGGPILMDYLTRLHKEFRAPFHALAPSSHTLQLAIPMSALNDYGVELRPAPIKESPSAPETAPSTRRPKVRTRSASSIDLGAILRNPTLTSSQKLKRLNMIYEMAENNDSQTNSARTVQQYEGLLAGVNADSDDSEVKARRAGALPDTDSSSKAAVKVWMSESDEEATKDEGEGEGEAEPEVEDDGRDGDDSEGDDQDKSEAEIVDEEDTEAEESGGVVSTAENEGEADEEYNGGVGESDVDPAPTKPRQHRFFDADGGLSSPAGSESNGEADSDGEGASGAVATQVDGDQTMMTAVASDSEDD